MLAEGVVQRLKLGPVSEVVAFAFDAFAAEAAALEEIGAGESENQYTVVGDVVGVRCGNNGMDSFEWKHEQKFARVEA